MDRVEDVLFDDGEPCILDPVEAFSRGYSSKAVYRSGCMVPCLKYVHLARAEGEDAVMVDTVHHPYVQGRNHGDRYAVWTRRSL